MSTTPDDLKTRHRAMWALGDYPAVATEVIAPLGDVLVDACGIGPGQRVVDVAAGSGNAAIPAARRGADVVATDLTPELLDIGRRAADAEGVSLRWQVADAEDMPCEDGEQDVAISCVGVMFAPHHQAAADELVRIVRPGGTIGLISWTPEGFIGQMFATMRPFVPAPPPGVQPPPLWGHLDHVRDLLGDRVTDIDAASRSCRSRTSRREPSSGTSSRRRTDRRSWRTAASPTTRHVSPSWTASWRRWATATWSTASWSGSTCSSPRCAPDRHAEDLLR